MRHDLMKLVVTAILLLTLIPGTALTQLIWSGLSTGTTKSLRAIKFRTPLDGWAVGSRGVIVHTSDGGMTWSEDSLEWNGRKPLLSFLELQDSLNIWTGWWGDPWYRTTDGGLTWNSRWIDSVGNTSRIVFVRSNLAFASGFENGSDFSGRVLRSTDGGEAWHVVLDTAHRAFYDIGFADSLRGFAVGATAPTLDNFDPGVIFRTTDGGSSWMEVLNLQNGPFERVSIKNHDVIWVGGDNGRLFVTVDGGDNWTQTGPWLSGSWVSSISVAGSHRVWITPNQSNTVYFSEDLGLNWSSSQIPDGGKASALFFYDETSGWAAGDSGSVWSLTITTTVSPVAQIPTPELLVRPNVPNPFNPKTSIRFSLAKPSFVNISVFDLLGRLVTTIADGSFRAGEHDAVFDGVGFGSGMYIYFIRTDNQVLSGKMLLSK